jgi:hypothetical protein
VPVSVAVRNQGGTAADPFKLSAHNGSLTLPFSVGGQSSGFYPSTNSSLSPGSTVSFSGNVTLPNELGGSTVSLRIVADSCDSDEFMPSFCRVDESNESNNESARSIFLPVFVD